MLTYSPDNNHPPRVREKPWLLFLLIAVWLFSGIVGHSLWDDREALLCSYSNALLNGTSWLVPTVYGLPYLESSPLYLWLAAIFQWLLGFLGFPPYLAVRILTAVLMGLSLLCLGLASHNFLGRRAGRLAVLLTVGCIGIIIFGHKISTLPLIFLSLSLYAYAVSRFFSPHIELTAFFLFLSFLLLFFTINCVLTLILIGVSLLLLFHPAYRCNFHTALWMALGLFLPAGALSLIILYQFYPQAFFSWLNLYSLFPFGGVRDFQWGEPTLYYLKNLLWYAFPAWILALLACLRLKKIWQKPSSLFFILWILLVSVPLYFEMNPSNNGLIGILPPLVLLASMEVDHIKRGIAAFLNFFGIAAFGAFALFIWAEYLSLQIGVPEIRAHSLYFNPLYHPHLSLLPITIATLFTLIWFYAISRKGIKGRLALSNWVIGVTFIWLLLTSLFLEWLNTYKSYLPLADELQSSLPISLITQLQNNYECVDSDDLEALIAWNELGFFKVRPSSSLGAGCRYHLALDNKKLFLTAHPEAVEIWGKARTRLKNRSFLLWH